MGARARRQTYRTEGGAPARPGVQEPQRVRVSVTVTVGRGAPRVSQWRRDNSRKPVRASCLRTLTTERAKVSGSPAARMTSAPSGSSNRRVGGHDLAAGAVEAQSDPAGAAVDPQPHGQALDLDQVAVGVRPPETQETQGRLSRRARRRALPGGR